MVANTNIPKNHINSRCKHDLSAKKWLNSQTVFPCCLVQNVICLTCLNLIFQDKPVHIAERPKDYKPRDPLEFVRNIWGKETFFVYSISSGKGSSQPTYSLCLFISIVG